MRKNIAKEKKIQNIAIISLIDEFANAVRPIELKRYLEKEGHRVTIIDALFLSRLSKNRRSILSKLPNPQPYHLLLYIVEVLIFFLDKYLIFLKKRTYALILLWQMHLKAIILYSMLSSVKYDLIIGDSTRDSAVLAMDLKTKTFYDCTSPWIEELYFGNEISKEGRNLLLKNEIQIYKKCDYIGFPWEMYTNYVKRHIYNGNNFIQINWGCHAKPEQLRSKYNSKPRIIFLGYLGGYWINFPLLSKLAKIYTIDVYGGPAPDKKWGLNYKGYAPTTDVIKDYQFGLITISKDKLRKSSFSSKHLEYLSYGLPVLTPDWRQDKVLKDVSIYYDENSFLAQIKKYSQKEKWKSMSNKCYKRAKEWDWDKVLEPINILLEENPTNNILPRKEVHIKNPF